ncbi:MAG: alpha-glucan family phosphorylase [Gammaproteobacteria bacterium]
MSSSVSASVPPAPRDEEPGLVQPLGDAPIHAPRPLPAPLAGLTELALDLTWSWNHGANALWREIDSTLWERTANPWLILQAVSRRRLEALAFDPEFVARLERLLAARRRKLAQRTWFEEEPASAFSLAAYFSMEFGIGEALPIYSGGLGVLAGDMLKTASDLGVPMIGVGLLYQRGYFRQAISAAGDQLEYFPYNDPATLPIAPLRDANGEWVHLSLPLPGRMLALRAWQAWVGRVKLYLLDSNDPGNAPADRGITGELYGGDLENRLMQEIILGIGGWRLLETLGLGAQINLCHLNEGHAAFAALAHAAAFASRRDTDFETALTAVRSGTLFTTHTPVDAAFDRFPEELISAYLAPYARGFGVPLERILAFGADPGHEHRGSFNMAALAMRTCGGANGVSRLHAKVSRRLFAPLFGGIPLSEVPLGAVTNGVHMPSWDSPAADRLWTGACGENRWRGDLAGLAGKIASVESNAIWRMRGEARARLVTYLAPRIAQSRRRRGQEHTAPDLEAPMLSADALTLCFARRFTAYKRPLLLLHDPERLLRLLNNSARPVQIVIAGKAHPRDETGKWMIRRWQEFIAREEVRGRVVFIEDYDMAIAAELVQGVDVWLNTPRQPWEASGTSGMKVLVNGGLNLSERDGWWAEAWRAEVGWLLADGGDGGDAAAADAREAEALYTMLEEVVVPEFYDRDTAGVPRRWVTRIRASMAALTPEYSSNRMLREYVRDYYRPMAARFVHRAAGNAAAASEINRRLARIRAGWPAVRIESPSFEENSDGVFTASAHADLDGIEPADVILELYAESVTENEAPDRVTLAASQALPGMPGGWFFEARFTPTRPLGDYVLRIRPTHSGLLWPLECPEIRWQR